jgi:hypothetical protein
LKKKKRGSGKANMTEVKRKQGQGSMQMQDEVQELAIEE